MSKTATAVHDPDVLAERAAEAERQAAAARAEAERAAARVQAARRAAETGHLVDQIRQFYDGRRSDPATAYAAFRTAVLDGRADQVVPRWLEYLAIRAQVQGEYRYLKNAAARLGVRGVRPDPALPPASFAQALDAVAAEYLERATTARLAELEKEAGERAQAAEQAARTGKPLPPANRLESAFPEITFTCEVPDRVVRLRHLSIKFTGGKYTTRHPDEIAYFRRLIATDPYSEYAEEGAGQDDDQQTERDDEE